MLSRTMGSPTTNTTVRMNRVPVKKIMHHVGRIKAERLRVLTEVVDVRDRWERSREEHLAPAKRETLKENVAVLQRCT